MSELGHRFVAEIIGPAGAGKTTLSRLLGQSEDVRSDLSVWRLPAWLLIVSAFSSIPKLLVLCCMHRCLGWEEAKLVIQLNALHLLLHLESAKGYQTLLLDEGIIFALSKLDQYSCGRVGAHSHDEILRFLNRPSKMLDAVIWLDAPDEVLAPRIRERAKPHRIKHESDAETQEHFASCRKSFEKIVAELNRSNGLKVIRFSTDKESLEQIAAKILSQAHLRDVEVVEVATSVAGV